jgi:hypothetical protein
MKARHSQHALRTKRPVASIRFREVDRSIGALSRVLVPVLPVLALLASAWASPAGASRNPYAASVHLRTTQIHGEYRGYELHISFKAPVAVPNAKAAYGLEIRLPQIPVCGHGGTQGRAIERNVRRGERISTSYQVYLNPGCQGLVQGKVLYGPQPDAMTGPGAGAHTVGNFSFMASSSG